MLSRSNSNAGDRLRRAKSTSSTHTSSSGHHRTSTSIDPFVTRQQAEVAAVEAYQRALQFEDSPLQADRPAPPKLQRRRSQVTGKTEGSHFEDARLGRRKSNSRKDNVGNPKPIRTHQQRRSYITDDDTGEDVLVTRKRSVIPPNPSSARTQYYNSSLPSSGRYLGKPQTGYSDGSPLPRHASTLKERSSALQVPYRAYHSEGGHDDLAQSSDDCHVEDGMIQRVQASRSPVRETQSDEAILAMARDKCLQDFHKHRLRERKSFILAPFQRRKVANSQKKSESSYDTTLPPYNYADEIMPPPLPQSPPLVTVTVHPEKKDRNFSTSLKGRFMKVFRKESRAPSGLPPQHIEATQYHYSTSSSLPTPLEDTAADDDPFVIASQQTNIKVLSNQADSASSRDSVGEQSTGKSRVTSWTNSTVAGTRSSRYSGEPQDLAEHGRLARSDSMSTLRKASSFFGRSMKNRLHRPSKAELRSSEESAGLYSALQERIKSPDLPSGDGKGDEGSRSETTSALSTLPSQQRAQSTVSSRSRWTAPTIRSVTPDPGAYKLGIPSPVTEVMSPDVKPTGSSSLARFEDGDSRPTPRSQLQRRPAMKAPTPSEEQIARRIERSKNRWQSPLDESSPPAPRSRRAAAMMDDNPYELRSLSRALQQPIANNDLPHHAKVAEQRHAARQDVLSPSVYSRGTDGDTPRADTPVEHGGMMVTITGREVRSYSISPPKRQQRVEHTVQGSQDWRRWLSDEMHGFDDFRPMEDLALQRQILTGHRFSAGASGVTDRKELLQMDEELAAFASSTVDQGGTQEPQAKESDRIGKPSTMNTGKSSKAENIAPRTVTAHGGAISRHASFANFDSVTDHCTLNGKGTSHQSDGSSFLNSGFLSPNDISTTQVTTQAKKAYKPKSAFELRANYKRSTSGKAKPIEVRRKPVHTNDNIYILEDTTIQNISAGPYACQQPNIPSISGDGNKENTPRSEANSLPICSSSEWLAAGTKKVRNTRNVSSVHPAHRDRSVSRYSPARTVVPSGDGSPGQRMVTNWLDGKGEKENSPVFV